MNSLQNLFSSKVRATLAVVLGAALVSGFFVSHAEALITSLTLTDPTGGEEWRGLQDITWTATDNGTPNNISILLSTNSGGSYSNLVNSISSADGTYSWDTTMSGVGVLPDGATYRIRVFDPGTGLDGASITDFLVDNTAPVTSISLAPAAPNGLNGWYITVPTITLTCDDSATGNSGCLAGSTEYRWNGGAWTPYAAPFAALEGSNLLEWRSQDEAVDALGAHNVEAIQSQTISVDTIAPTVAVTSTTVDGAYNAGDLINVTLTFSENVSSTDFLTVNLDSGGSCVIGGLANTNVGTCTYTVAGGHNSADLTVTSIVPNSGVVEDIAGNDSTLVPTSNLAATSNIVIDTTAPIAFQVGAVTTTGGNVVAGWWNNTNTGVDVTISLDNDASLVGGTIQVQAEADGAMENLGSAYTILLGDINGNKTLSFIAAELEGLAGFSDGDNITFTAIITDIAENSTTGAPVSASDLDVDQEAPAVNAGVDQEDNVLINQDATVSDGGGSGIASYAWTKESGSGTVTFGTAAAEDTTVDANADDTYVIRLTVFDTAGNSTFDEATFVRDTTAPNLAAVTLVPTPTNDTTPGYTFSVDKAAWLPGNTGTINIVGSCGAWTPSAALDGNNVITFTGPLGDATYTDCDITVTDFAGNASAVLEINDFEVDTVPAFTNTAGITTADVDLNGSIDTVTIVFDDPVDDSTFSAADFTVGGVVPTAIGTGGTPDDNTIVLTMGTQVAGTESKTVAYTQGGALDLAGNTIANFSFASTDVAKPVLISAITTSVTTINAHFSEDLNGATVNGSGNEFTVTGFAVSAATESAPGVITLTVATMPTDATPDVTYTQVDQLDDLAAVPNTAVTPVTVEAVDGVAPVLTSVTISSNNAKDGALWAKEGNTVTLLFTGSEQLAVDPVVTIAGESATVSDLGSNNWQATLVMDGDDPEGQIAFAIDFEDVATPTHNVGTQVTAITGGTNITYDRTNPSVSAGDDNEINAAFTQTTASASDAGSGLDFVTWSKVTGPGTVSFTTTATIQALISTNQDGVYELQLFAEDEAGNSATDTMNLIWDTRAPVLEFINPPHLSTGVSTSDGTLFAHFRQFNGAGSDMITLLDQNGVFVEDQADGTDYQTTGSIAVQGGNDSSRILEVPYAGLAGGTTYCLTILSGSVRDAAGNTTTQDTEVRCFTTEIDTVAPLILSILASNVDSDSADITVTTNEPAVCRISDTPEAYGDMDPFDSGSTTHLVNVDGLTENTAYTMYVRCRDAATNESSQASVNFTTLLSDTVAPPAPVITTVEATVNADSYVIAGTAGADTPVNGPRTITVFNGANVVGDVTIATGQTSWAVVVPLTQNATSTFTATSKDTNGNESVASNSVDIGDNESASLDLTAPAVPALGIAPDSLDADVYNVYGTLADDGSVRFVKLYNNGLTAGTDILGAGETDWSISALLSQNGANEFTARSMDISGNLSDESTSVTITETPSDSTAPVVSAVANNVTDTEADIEITVNESAVCRVGPTDAAFGSLPTELSGGSPDTGHLYELTGLSDGTEYDFFVRCQDAAGNTSEAVQVEFTTDSNDSTGPVIQGIQAVSIDHESVTIEWVTDESADSQVEYGPTSGYGTLTVLADTPVATDGVLNHSVTITGLDSSTTYHFRVLSTDASGNTTTSGDNTFETTFDDSTAILEVTGISAIKTFATADDTFENGWSWIFYITVPTDETDFAMKFADFISGGNTIDAADNIRYYTAQSSEAEDDTEAVTIAGADTYPGAIELDSDLDSGTAGRQIAVTVEMKVPVGTTGGSYSASYGVASDDGSGPDPF